jgi:hypothetical protein
LDIGERKRQRALDFAADRESPAVRIHHRDVVMSQEVVQADRGDVVAQRLEWDAVVARGKLQLGEGELLAWIEAGRSWRVAIVRMRRLYGNALSASDLAWRFALDLYLVERPAD